MPTRKRDPRRLTARQRRLAEKFMERYPDPVWLCVRWWPAEYRRARRMGIDHDEIRSACHAAVMRAAFKFDRSRGFQFATYVKHWVRGLVCRLVVHYSFACRFGRPVRGDRWVDGSDQTAWDAMGLADSREPSPTVGAVDGDRRGHVAGLLRALPARLREVLTLRFGLADGVERTQEEVGALLGLTRQRIQQMERKAIERIRIPAVLTCSHLAGGDR